MWMTLDKRLGYHMDWMENCTKIHWDDFDRFLLDFPTTVLCPGYDANRPWAADHRSAKRLKMKP
jgi:hypothetical protein